MNKKILIAYYSKTGNTKAVAQKIQNIVNGSLFEISPVFDYPDDYNSIVNVAKKEKEENIFPKLQNNTDVQNYDIIFLGTPVWWYTVASPVKTFLAENNFQGKVILPFCTHGGGGASSVYTDIKKLSGAKVLDGYTVYENSAKTDDIKKWITNLNIIKLYY
ncbi:MAG: NAD(P)H-dependent oxidoreductase [Candidatus Gastranaerophilales bacterium]|nr:NAD(P)H-dependent oxidoreductase [Candidatus Gastranaerophilales bacterium]